MRDLLFDPRLSLLPRFSAGASDARVRLRTLTLIRWLGILGQGSALLIIQYYFEMQFPFVQVALIILSSFVFNLIVSIWRPGTTWLKDRDAAIHLSFDLVQLSALLYLTGGLANPFVIFMLAPITVSASVLSGRATVLLALLATLLVSVLAVWSRPLPSLPHINFAPPDIFLFGIWIVMALSITFVAIYVHSLSREARRMGEALGAAQLALAREQKLSALGGLAAIAAHQLGTPLATIQLVARELERDLPPDASWRDDIALLVSESRRCRDILAQLADKPEADGSAHFHLLPIDTLVETAARPYLRDAVEFEVVCRPLNSQDKSKPRIRRDAELLHGLGTLIQNAIQFAKEKVTAEVLWNSEEIGILLRDDGPGFDEAVLGLLGEPYLSTAGRDVRRTKRGEHMGLGVFIAKTLLTHSGARIEFRNRHDGGSEIELRWRRSDLEYFEPEERIA